MCMYVYRVHMYICIYMVCMCVRVCMCIYVYVWVSMYVHLCICIYVCVCVFACGWIYGVGVVQPKTRYLTWRLQYRLQLMVKETLMFQRAKIEIIKVSVMLLERLLPDMNCSDSDECEKQQCLFFVSFSSQEHYWFSGFLLCQGFISRSPVCN